MAEVVPNKVSDFYQIMGVWEHPWNDWFNGQTWVLDPVADFNGLSVKQVRYQVYYMARKRDIDIRTRVEGDKLKIRAVAS